MNRLTVGELATLVAGEVRGDAERLISGMTTAELAGEHDLTFIADQKNLSRLTECRAGCVLIPATLVDKVFAAAPHITAILVADPSRALYSLASKLRPALAPRARRISPQAIVSPLAAIGKNCYIGPCAVIEDDVVIGDDCEIHAGAILSRGSIVGRGTTIYPNATIYSQIVIGQRVIIHAGAVIGADGFGYRFEAGQFEKIPQIGHVVIEDDVEIGACTTVDRGALGPTVIGQGTKIDNMVMIAHNCQIGRHNVFASQVGLAGSCRTGDYVQLGGQAGIKDHVTLHTGSSVGAKGAVHCDIPAGEKWFGYPATPEGEQKRLMFTLKRVPEMREQLKAMGRQVEELTQQIATMTGQKPEGQSQSEKAAA